jgi:glycosyltransferase involved in cell wall biosynthesis
MGFRIGIDARKVRDFGIGTYVRHLVQELAEIDQENEYVLIVGPDGREALPELPTRFRFSTESSKVYSLREQVSLSVHLARLRLDLFHATHYVLPLWVPSRTIVTIHDIIHLLYPEFLPNRLAYVYAQRMIRRALNRSERVLTVSHTTRRDLGRYFELGMERIAVIYNGVEQAFREILPQDVRVGRLAELGVSEPYLLFVGNPKPHKNLDRLLEAYALAQGQRPFAAPLVIVGNDPDAGVRIRLRADHLGIADQVKVLGRVDDQSLPVLYQGATLFLYPTLYEGFGLPVVEAMASGAPVVTSNSSALKEIAEGYAHLVDPLDVEAMAEAIGYCMAEPDHRSSLAKLGKKRAEQFSWRETAVRTLEVYQRVLQEARRR